MTDFIDLSTLGALGQHFSTVEDVAELKTMLVKVQSDLSAIKGFLTNEYGANFSNNLGVKSTSTKVIPVPVIKRISAHAATAINDDRVDEQQLKMKQVPSMNKKPAAVNNAVCSGGELSKPPPLLRFRGGDIVANGSDKTNMSGGSTNNDNSTTTGGSLAVVKKPERFQRNFLSMSSLKSSTGSGVGIFKSRSISKTIGSSSYGSGGGFRGNGNLKIESESSSDIHEESFTPEEVKQNTVSMYNARSLNNGSYNLPDMAIMEEIDDAEGENYDDDDPGQLEEDENVEYVMDVGNDQNGYDDSTYMEELPDGSYNYDEDYSVDYGSDGLEILDVSSNNFKAINRNSSANGKSQERATTKKAQLRRITLPEADGSLQKECKVCHGTIKSEALFTHVINTHYSGEIPTCQICKKTFTYRQGLISHMRYHDAEKYDKACSYCGKRFIRKSDVVIHERRLHTGERPYQCPAPDCNQGFVRRYCLLTHVKTNHGEPYMSQIMADAGKRRKSS